MNRKALTSIAALALFALAAPAAPAQTTAPAPPAQPAAAPPTAAPARPAAPAASAAPVAPQPAAVAAAQAAPSVAATVPRAVAPAAPAPPQEPAPPAVATTFFIQGNFLGVHTEEITRENASRYGLSGPPRGVGVREVVKGSPAEKAGLRAGDVILRYDGEPVTSARKLTRLIEESAPEHSARLTILRSGSEQEVSATLARRAPFVNGSWNFGDDILNEALRMGDEAARNSEQWKRAEEQARKKMEGMRNRYPGFFGGSRRIGVTTSALGKQLAEYFGVTHGVLVSSVEAGSPAERAGLRAGDVVTEADGRAVGDADDLVRALGAKQEGEVTLTVVRDRKSRTVRVTPERRAAPQGLLTPGSFRVLDPVAATTLPRALVLPEVTPRVLATPRVLTTPRVRVFSHGDRVL